MTEKVKITQEQADSLELYKRNGHKLKQFVVHGERGFHGYYAPLKGLPIDDMARLLYEPNSYEIEPEPLEVGNWAVRKNTRRILRFLTDEKDVAFKIKGIKGSSVIGDDGNNHSIYALRHATPEEIKTEQERRKWAEIEEGDVLIGTRSGKYAAFFKLFPERREVEVLIRNGTFEHWDADACKLYAKKVKSDA